MKSFEKSVKSRPLQQDKGLMAKPLHLLYAPPAGYLRGWRAVSRFRGLSSLPTRNTRRPISA